MLREQSRLLLAIHQAADFIIITLSFYLAYITKVALPGTLGRLDMLHNYYLILMLALVSCHVSLRLFGAYDRYRLQTLRSILLKIFKALTVGTVGTVVLSYVLHLEAVSRLLVFFFFCYCLLFLGLFKITLYKLLARGRRNDYNIRTILIIGTRQRALEFIQKIILHKESGYRILGCIDTVDQIETIDDKIADDIKVIGTLDDFSAILDKQIVDEVVFALPLQKVENVHEYIFYAEVAGINVRVLPDFQIDRIKYYPQTAEVQIENFLGAPTLALSSVPKNSNDLLLKSCIDYTVAFCGITLLSPLLLVIAVAIKLTSKGPVFFSQERSGLNGRRFSLHKFRTMVANAEELRQELQSENEMDGPVFKMKKDPRVTWIGSFLRRTSLDELPQLFNVLNGKMSLVGPRPHIPSEVKNYKLWQRRRLSMKPGLTCIWQVSGRNDISFEQWMNMDLEYIDSWSLGLDFKLMLLTIKEVMAGGGR